MPSFLPNLYRSPLSSLLMTNGFFQFPHNSLKGRKLRVMAEGIEHSSCSLFLDKLNQHLLAEQALPTTLLASLESPVELV